MDTIIDDNKTMIWKVEVNYWRMRGGWSDVYLVEAKSQDDAVAKLKNWLDDDDDPTMVATEIPLRVPYLIIEG